MISHSNEEPHCCHERRQPAPETVSSDDRCRVHLLAPDAVLDDIRIHVEMNFSSRREFMPALVG